MAVKIGSARIDENGNTTGGTAGDQTGKEVSTQSWYLHSKGWRVFRPTSITMAKLIAEAMQAACDNDNIGYDQNQRNTLYNQVKTLDFDPAQATTACETDCSALVRVCCAYAGITLSDFNTSTEATRLKSSGYFTELTDDKYTKKSSYLGAGDILVTKTKGHTVVVLSNGSNYDGSTGYTTIALGDRILKNGMSGDDVKELQSYLIQLGYDLGKWGADGDFGDCTEEAVRAFQLVSGCTVDGEVGSETLAALETALGGDTAESGTTVRISGGNCYVRSEASTDGTKLGVAYNGDTLPYRGETSDDGWHAVTYNSQDGWVSGKYGVLED